MGYTHYWTPKVMTPTESEKKFKKFFDVCQKLHDNLPEYSLSAGGYYKEHKIEIAGGDGIEAPLFGQFLIDYDGKTNHGQYVWFNGKEDENDLGHESFAISKNHSEWSFCKTARKPYDLLVCACLIAAGKILGYSISTDGDVKDWKQAFDLYAKVTGVKHVVKSKSKFLNKEPKKVAA